MSHNSGRTKAKFIRRYLDLQILIPNNLPVPGKVDLVCDMFSTNEQRYTIKCPYKFKGV